MVIDYKNKKHILFSKKYKMNYYKDRCRTCLGNSKEMRHIQTVIKIAGIDVRLTDILQKFYNYQMTTKESFPENICINCVHQLTVTYSFKVLIENSTKTLEECFALMESTGDNYDSDFGSDGSQRSDDQKVCNDFKHEVYIQTQNDQSMFVKETTVNGPSIEDIEFRNHVFCVECKEKFNSVKSLSEHCTENHPVKSTTGQDCDYCSEKFEDFGTLIKHMKLHLKPYSCDNCWDGFYSETELESHQCRLNRLKKMQDKVLQQCEQCGKSYPSGYIKLHIKIHGNDTPYSCKYCPKKFKVRCSLNSHVLWKHKKTKNHACHICNATFVSASSRSSHIRKEHFNERKHSCVTCGKRFFQRSDMDRHYLTHTGLKNFHCEMCDKSYQTKYGLNVHLKSHSHVQYIHKIEKNQESLA